MKKLTKTGRCITALCTFTVGCLVFSAVKFINTDAGMIGKEQDKLQYVSINVMLERPENWRQISSEPVIDENSFSGIDGSTATVPVTAELVRQFCGADANVYKYVSHNMTDRAYENLIYGKKNDNGLNENTVKLIFATPPSEDEYEMAKNEGVTLEVEPVALDGFVFITHKDNPVSSLTTQQIRDIYSGKITNWKDVGGKDEKIRAFQRTKNSGSQTAMEELVMQGEKMTEAPMYVANDMGGLIDEVAEYENESAAIGYTYNYYINNLYKSPDIKVIAVDGITPENENLVNNKYPFASAYYAVIRADEPENSEYRKLRDYMLTDEGQEIIRLAGYCPANG